MIGRYRIEVHMGSSLNGYSKLLPGWTTNVLPSLELEGLLATEIATGAPGRVLNDGLCERLHFLPPASAPSGIGQTNPLDALWVGVGSCRGVRKGS
jgi:hypothetical protein